MKYKVNWIASLLLLACLSYNSYSQSYIAKHYRGDDIPLDSFAVMDLATYSGIRKGAALYDQLSKADKGIIAYQDSILTAFGNMAEANNLKMELLMEGIARRDSTIESLYQGFIEVKEINVEAQGYLEELNKSNKKKFILFDERFLLGVGVGALGLLFLK